MGERGAWSEQITATTSRRRVGPRQHAHGLAITGRYWAGSLTACWVKNDATCHVHICPHRGAGQTPHPSAMAGPIDTRHRLVSVSPTSGMRMALSCVCRVGVGGLQFGRSTPGRRELRSISLVRHQWRQSSRWGRCSSPRAESRCVWAFGGPVYRRACVCVSRQDRPSRSQNASESHHTIQQIQSRRHIAHPAARGLPMPQGPTKDQLMCRVCRRRPPARVLWGILPQATRRYASSAPRYVRKSLMPGCRTRLEALEHCPRQTKNGPSSARWDRRRSAARAHAPPYHRRGDGADGDPLWGSS